jgi:predicted nucleic acid-binding protein
MLALLQLEQLCAQALEIEAEIVSMRQAFTTARTYNLSAYDSVYLDLALRARLPLATLDAALRKAAGKAGVELLH